MKILYPQANSEIAILFPISNEPILNIAKKCVPYNTPYLIVEDSALPAEWETSAAWEADFSNPDGIGLGPQRYFIAKAEAEIAEGINVEQNQAIINLMKAEVLQLEGVQL